MTPDFGAWQTLIEGQRLIDVSEAFERAFERMTQKFVDAIVLARGSTPAEAIAHRMERAG